MYINQQISNLSIAFKNGVSENLDLPPFYVIEPTNVCNFDCVMCPNRLYEEYGQMDFSMFVSIIDQIAPYAKVIMLYYVGEPLLHLDIIKMIRYGKEHSNAKIIMSTNSSVLEGEIREQLLTSGLDEMILCVEGSTSNTHESIRRGSDFDQVVRNTEDFIVTSSKVSNIDCTVQMISMHLNKPEIDDFKRYWSSYDCTVLVTWMSTWASQFPDMMSLTDNFCPSKDLLRQPCAELWYKMVINWKGEVVICCLDWAGHEVMGKVDSHSLEEIWNSEKLIRTREKHFEGEFNVNSICGNCFEWSTEEEILDYIVDMQNRQTWFV